MSNKSKRPSPSESASLYKVGTKKKGNDGNTWIIKENKNGIKRWVPFKKVQVSKFYNLNIRFEANVLLLGKNGSKLKAYKPVEIIKKSELSKVIHRIHNFRDVDNMMIRYFGPFLIGSLTKKWTQTHLVANIPIKIANDKVSYKNILKRIHIFYEIFTRGARHTFLRDGTLGAVMYHSADKKDYEYILDNLRFKITHDGKLLRNITYPKYWK